MTVISDTITIIYFTSITCGQTEITKFAQLYILSARNNFDHLTFQTCSSQHLARPIKHSV